MFGLLGRNRERKDFLAILKAPKNFDDLAFDVDIDQL